MNIQPIAANACKNATNFKGYFVKYNSYPLEVDGASARHAHWIRGENVSNSYVDYEYSYPSDFSIQRALKRFSGHDDPNCYVEFIKKPKNEYGIELRDYNVYFADPQEGITEAIREKANYIVYDTEPSYPHIDKEIGKAYFEGENSKEYPQHYNTVKKYFKRLEKADSRTLTEIQSRDDIPDKNSKIEYYKGRIKDAVLQQKNADDCVQIYAEAEGLRAEIGELFSQRKTLWEKLKQISYSIEYPEFQEEKILAEKRQNLEKYKADFELLKNKIKGKQLEIAPFFEKLKNLYMARGIKVIKHI